MDRRLERLEQRDHQRLNCWAISRSQTRSPATEWVATMTFAAGGPGAAYSPPAAKLMAATHSVSGLLCWDPLMARSPGSDGRAARTARGAGPPDRGAAAGGVPPRAHPCRHLPVEAFRNAVKTLKPLDAVELRERADAGTLQEIPGIGKSTSGVIAEALAGELPAYLGSLQEKSGGPLVDGGESTYAALRGDCHLHSDWSDGGSPIDEMVLTASSWATSGWRSPTTAPRCASQTA